MAERHDGAAGAGEGLQLRTSRFSWRLLLAVAGPGLVAMFADTDAGSVFTVAESGAQWG
jgi:Mn2+/Fe2+ NRAMP family transporter